MCEWECLCTENTGCHSPSLSALLPGDWEHSAFQLGCLASEVLGPTVSALAPKCLFVGMHGQAWLFSVGAGDSRSGGRGYLTSTLTARLTSQPLHLTFETGPEAVNSALYPIQYMHVCVPFLVTCVKNLCSHDDPFL